MRIGVGLPFMDASGTPLDGGGIATRARWIEDAGLDGIWIGDASFRGLATWPEPLTWLLAACLATEQVEVGTAIFQVPLREPVVLAQQLMTIAALTHNRFTVGVGPGSTEAAFRTAVGASYPDRFATFNESMTTIRRLLGGERVGDADIEAWPSVHGKPRFALGAWASERSLRRAVEEYDGWFCSAMHSPFGEMAEALRRYRDLGGTRAIVASCTADLAATATPIGPGDAFNLRCGPSEATDRLGTLAELGFDDVILNIRDSTKARIFDGDITLEQVEAIRALHPVDPRRAFAIE